MVNPQTHFMSAIHLSRYWPFLGLALILILFTLFVNVPGYLTWDSGTYNLMARTLLETGGFFVPNGYESINSPLLVVGQTVPHGGRLVSQYPEYYTFLALPFFAVFGFQGFTVLNTLAFIGTCVLIWRIACWFSSRTDAPVAAVVIYAFATFAWEYTQSSYPHLTSTFLIVLACWLAWGAWLEKDELPVALPHWLRLGVGRYLLAGLVFGTSVGVRLDSAFAALALALLVIQGSRIRWSAALAMFAGALPALLGLAWINLIKFEAFIPFSYGRPQSHGATGSIVPYMPLAGFVAILTLLYVLQIRGQFRVDRKYIVLLFVAAGVGLLLTSFGQRLARGVFQLVVDLRIRPDIAEPALSRSPGNAVVYFGNVKKALIESSPFLVLIALPALSGLLRGSYGIRWLLWLVPLGFIGFYGFFAWHGSVALNMRYLNPTLPFLAILASQEWLRLRPAFAWRTSIYWLGIIIVWCALLVFLFLQVRTLEGQETFLLNGALALAALLLILQVIRYLGLGKPWLKKSMASVFLFSLIWSSAVVLSRDYMMSRSVRILFLNIAVWAEEEIPDNAVLLSHSPDMAWGLLDRVENLIIANYRLGTPADAAQLVHHYIDERPIIMLTPHKSGNYAEYLDQIGSMEGIKTTVIKQNPRLSVDLLRVERSN